MINYISYIQRSAVNIQTCLKEGRENLYIVKGKLGPINTLQNDDSFLF